MKEYAITDCITHYLQRTGSESLQPSVALIDMDGTLINSMGHHTAAWHRMATELGVECTQDEFYLYEGMTGGETISRLIRRAFNRDATEAEKVELYELKAKYFNEMPMVGVVPGARKMVDTLMLYGVARVLVTGSGQRSNLDRLEVDFPGGFLPDMRITSANVTHCKPHPEPYLRGMELAGAQPWQSIAIENAPLGVRSAVDAGAFTIAVTTGPIPKAEMIKAGADMVFDSMVEFADILPKVLDTCGVMPKTINTGV